jgi:hypothetical protein
MNQFPVIYLHGDECIFMMWWANSAGEARQGLERALRDNDSTGRRLVQVPTARTDHGYERDVELYPEHRRAR